MAEYERMGTMYLRGTYYISHAVDGVERAIWAKMIPMLCKPEHFWFNSTVIGSVTGTAPDGSQEMHIRAAINNINLSQEDVETTDFNGDELLDRYFDPIAGRSFSGDDGDSDVDLGLSNQTGGQRSPLYAKSDLYSRTVRLGLPNKAVFSDANQITYVDQRSFNQAIDYGQFSLELPSAVVMGLTTDSLPDQTDWSTALTGDAGGMNDLYLDILQYIGRAAAVGVPEGKNTINTALQDYMSKGVRLASVDDVEQVLHSRVNGTLKVGVYARGEKHQVLTTYR